MRRTVPSPLDRLLPERQLHEPCRKPIAVGRTEQLARAKRRVDSVATVARLRSSNRSVEPFAVTMAAAVVTKDGAEMAIADVTVVKDAIVVPVLFTVGCRFIITMVITMVIAGGFVAVTRRPAALTGVNGIAGAGTSTNN